MNWDKLIDALKLSPKYLFPVSLSTGLILFLDNKAIDYLGLLEFRDQYKSWISIIFLLTCSIIITNIFVSSFNFLKNKIKNRRISKSMRKYLDNLSEQEKVILRGYIFNNVKTRYFDVTDGLLTELIANKVIYQSSNIGELDSWAHNIQPWAWDYLKKNPHLLK